MIEGRTLWELVARRAEATPEALAMLDEALCEVSFAELRDRAERTAAGLYDLGIREDSAVSWLLPTRITAFVLMAALARVGAVQNPLLPIYREREMRFCLRQTGAQWLLVPKAYRGFDYAATAQKLAEEIPRLALLDIESALPQGDPSTLPAAPPSAEAAEAPVRWIFYTSGTTSDPKGARHADQAVVVSSRGLVEAIDLRPGDRIGVVFPVTHLGGANSLAASLISGATQLVVETFDPKTSVPFLSAHGMTHGGAGTVFHNAYLEAQRAHGPDPLFPNIRVCFGGGAAKPAPLHYAIEREVGGLGILSVYGMTEYPIAAVARTDDPEAKRVHTEGRPSPAATRIRVVRPDGTPAAAGEEGELRVSGPQLMRGYVDERLNAEAFDEDGFFRTGDLGSVDAEGYVSITGRLKDIIIRKGENISALEIEELLLDHPKVADVSVIGLPDPERGERCCAVVICRDAGAPLQIDEMVGFLRDRQLMIQKIPEQLELVTELPRNPSGKVVKRDLRQRFAG